MFTLMDMTKQLSLAYYSYTRLFLLLVVAGNGDSKEFNESRVTCGS